MPPEPIRADVAVVGAGAAGLAAARYASEAGGTVALVSAVPLAATSSYWAQGGIAAALGDDDSPERHLADTVAAGRGLTRVSAARVLVEDAPARVRDLERWGVHFDGERVGALALGLEGGHTRRRVVHAGGSATGRRVVRQLSAVVAEDPRITVLEGSPAVALWTVDGRCVGLRTLDGRAVLARGVVLATGGSAALWSRTTNPPGAVGSGLVLGLRAGAALADLELVQFHPTAVAGVPGIDGFLVTEAIRGEGATLHGAGGERFVEELAPRDEVALAVWRELRRTGSASVGLDMRAVDPGAFPNVVAKLREGGLDPARELVPVAPAAHYVMGGLAADLDGRTSVPGLLAVGECACTGLHGANRLASNSLSECTVFGRRAALAALDGPAPDPAAAGTPPESASPPALTPAIRRALWEHAGLERSPGGLGELARAGHPLAALVGACALARTESRGAHHRTDRPHVDPALDGHHTVARPGAAPALEAWG